MLRRRARVDDPVLQALLDRRRPRRFTLRERSRDPVWQLAAIMLVAVVLTSMCFALLYVNWLFVPHSMSLALQPLQSVPWFRAAFVVSIITFLFAFFARWFDPGEEQGLLMAYAFGPMWIVVFAELPTSSSSTPITAGAGTMFVYSALGAIHYASARLVLRVATAIESSAAG